ncbi:MAG: hypothetical protein JNM62_13110 [Flavobacteriales bacterium]|nr:hypothetical protein [Flavobacteriales bacterium]
MGYKASMIIVEKPLPEIGDERLLQELGFTSCAPLEPDYLENCMYPRDKSIGIGRFNGCLIITEDYQLTGKLERAKMPGALGAYEQALSRLFPGSEILSVACHSVTNFAFHSLVKDGVKLRYRCISGDDKPLEHGAPLKEEEPIYARSKMVDGVRMFRGDDEAGSPYEYVEDQLMEDFTFGVAKRLLGVRIDRDEADELNEVLFQRYRYDPRRKVVPPGTRTWEGELATYWMEDGVLVALPHDVKRTVSNVRGAVELVKDITGGKRVPVLMHKGAADTTEEAAKLSAEQFPLVYSAMAWMQRGTISRWFANRRFKHAPVPSRVFASQQEAMEWLRQAR